jgi:hypothetical protein
MGHRRTRRETCPTATFYTTNPTWIDLGTNPDLRCERPTTNSLSHGTDVRGMTINTSVCRLRSSLRQVRVSSSARRNVTKKHTSSLQCPTPTAVNWPVYWQEQKRVATPKVNAFFAVLHALWCLIIASCLQRSSHKFRGRNYSFLYFVKYRPNPGLHYPYLSVFRMKVFDIYGDKCFNCKSWTSWILHKSAGWM